MVKFSLGLKCKQCVHNANIYAKTSIPLLDTYFCVKRMPELQIIFNYFLMKPRHLIGVEYI